LKKLTKVLALILILVFTTAAFTACSSDELSLLEAMVKSQSVTSMESNTDLTIQLDVSDLSEEYMQQAAILTQFLNNFKATINQKTISDPSTGSAKAQVSVNFNLAGISSNVNMWVETGLAGNKPAVKEIFQIPAFASMAVTGDPGKEYIVLDTSAMPGQSEITYPFDYSKFTTLNKDITEKTAQFYLSYAKNLKPGFTIAKSTGNKNINGKNLQSYELKLSDAALKELVSFLVNDLGTNKANLQLIKDYFGQIMTLAASMDPKAEASNEDFDKSFAEFEKGLPEFINGFNEAMKELKDVTILGEDGVTTNYLVDDKGYIAGKSSAVNMSLDLGKISQAVAEANGTEPEDVSGKINLKITAKTDFSKINEKVDITLPVLTEKNSVDYFSLLMEKMDAANIAISNVKPNSTVDTETVSVFVNGKRVLFKDAPVVRDGRTLAPAREVFEAMGGKLTWDEAAQTVTSKIGNNTVIFTIGSSEATVNGVSKALDVPAVLINGRAYVPVRFLSDSVGGKLTWIEKSSAIFINIK